MPKRPSILFLATLVALLALIALVLGPGRSLLPDRGAAVEPPDTDADVAAQLDDLITPPSDRAIDWGIFRVIPPGISDPALNVPTVGPTQRVSTTRITSLTEARSVLPVLYQNAFVPNGFRLSETTGTRTDGGSFPVQVGTRTVTTTAYELTMEYSHPDGRKIAFKQEVAPATSPWPVANPGASSRLHVRLGNVKGVPAIFRVEGSLDAPANTFVSIRWSNKGLLFYVDGRLSDLALLRKVADSVQ